MCCIFAALFALGPRAAIFIWWLIEPLRWQSAFDTVIWPIVGFFILPWTTLAYGVMWDIGTHKVSGFEWFVVGLAFLVDLGSYGGTARGRRA